VRILGWIKPRCGRPLDVMMGILRAWRDCVAAVLCSPLTSLIIRWMVHGSLRRFSGGCSSEIGMRQQVLPPVGLATAAEHDGHQFESGNPSSKARRTG